MYTRNGKLFYAPKWFTDGLPKNLALDGELWTKRNDFQNTVRIVRKQDRNENWSKVTYMVYDAPLLKDKKFAERLETIRTVLKDSKSSIVQLHKHEVCRGQAHLDKELDQVLALKGEGLMVKCPDSHYESNRSKLLLKVKVFQDSEATVIGHQKGTGRCFGMLGALECKTDDGILFKIGSGFDDKQRRKPPKIGSRVTFKYQGVSENNVPRFPIFLRQHPGI